MIGVFKELINWFRIGKSNTEKYVKIKPLIKCLTTSTVLHINKTTLGWFYFRLGGSTQIRTGVEGFAVFVA
jgi:hypothetical protein